MGSVIRKYLALLVIVLGVLLCSIWLHSSRKKDFQPVAREYSSIPRVDASIELVSRSSPRPLDFLPVTSTEAQPVLKRQGDGGSEVSVVESVQQCMSAVHIDHILDTTLSERNALYLFNEYRKVIPESSLEGYLSHCWKTSYSVSWAGNISGHIGNVSFDSTLKRRHPQLPFIIKYLTKEFALMKFESDMVCLPNVFLAGFPKCGSTYLYCVVNKLVDFVTQRIRTRHEVVKEPHFWASPNNIRNSRIPTVASLQSYILNFIPGFARRHKDDSSSGHSPIMLMDASPNIFFKWPKFKQDEPDLTNYCLIPSILPKLLPHSKYLVIMRNPIKMMYSAFWFSCTTIQGKLPMSVQLKGPHLFHNRAKQKIIAFNHCMRDNSVPQLNSTCSLESEEAYSRCIMGRLHLLDRCVARVTFNNFSPELADCGRTRIAMGIYYAHIRKWLQVVSEDRFLFLTLEDLVKDTKSVMISVLRFLGLSRDKSQFDNIAKRIQFSCDTNSQNFVNYVNDPRLSMRKDTGRMLNIFFHPFNQLLGGLINRTSLWST